MRRLSFRLRELPLSIGAALYGTNGALWPHWYALAFGRLLA